jgi:hypothetical protein
MPAEPENAPAKSVDAECFRLAVGAFRPSNDPQDPHQISFQDAVLRLAFGDPVPVEPLQMWGRLTPDRRELITTRLLAMLWWDNADKQGFKVRAADVARELKLSLNRVYRMRRDWAAAPSLSALGTFAGSPLQRAGKFEEGVLDPLRARARKLLSAHRGRSVEGVVSYLMEDFADLGAKLPSRSTVRNLVHEVRRNLPPIGIGQAVIFDCCAISVLGEGHRLHTAFFAIDPESYLVFGAALGELSRSRIAYAECSNNARSAVVHWKGPWAKELRLWKVIEGTDRDAWRSLDFNHPDQSDWPTTPGHYGHAIRRAIGVRLGTLELRATRTGNFDIPHGSENKFPYLSHDDMMRILSFEVENYNRGILENATDLGRTPPENLLSLFGAISNR